MINQYNIPPPPFWPLFCISCCGWWLLFVCTWCSCWCMLLTFFHLGLLILFCTYLLFTPGYFFLDLVTHTHRPILTHSLRKGFELTLIASHWTVGGRWVVLVGQRSETHESDFILVTQVRAIICCLLILFITQSGSCTLRPPRLLCCFELHRWQISSDITSSPPSSTATKTQTSNGLARRLNKSACNSGNVKYR